MWLSGSGGGKHRLINNVFINYLTVNGAICSCAAFSGVLTRWMSLLNLVSRKKLWYYVRPRVKRSVLPSLRWSGETELIGAERAVLLSAAFANCYTPFNPSALNTRIKRFVLPEPFCMEWQKSAIGQQIDPKWTQVVYFRNTLFFAESKGVYCKLIVAFFVKSISLKGPNTAEQCSPLHPAGLFFCHIAGHHRLAQMRDVCINECEGMKTLNVPK